MKKILMTALLFQMACGPLIKPVDTESPEIQIDGQLFCYLYVVNNAGNDTRESCYKDPIECEDARHFAKRRFDARVVSSCYREPND